MDFTKISTADVRAMDARKLADSVATLRKELVTLKMDVYNAGPQANAKARNMRKVLARMLSVSVEKSKISLNTKKK